MCSSDLPAPVRAAVIAALARWNAGQADHALRFGLRDTDPRVRSAAISNLDRLEGEDVPGLLRRLTGLGSADWEALVRTELKASQAAWAALASRDDRLSIETVRDGMARLLDGSVPDPIRADVLRAARRRAAKDSPLNELVRRWEVALPSTDPLARWRFSLAGGDAGRGRVVFRENAAVQCLRCHGIAGDGGTVGPKLDGIGKVRTREELLESIVYPSVKFAPGFSPAPGSPSAMPEGLAEILGLLDLRDVVEYLATLR